MKTQPRSTKIAAALHPFHIDWLIGCGPGAHVAGSAFEARAAVIDYDYIMGLISRFSQQKPGKQKMPREQLSDLMAPLHLGWKARTQAELALMADLHPLLTKRAGGRDISGLSAYEQ